MQKEKIKTFVIRWLPVIVWAGVIFSFSNQSSLPGTEVIWWDFFTKKIAHMVVYAILFFLIQRAINWQKPTKKYALSLIITLLYATSDEFHQSFIPGRTALPTDIGYDMIGASLVFLKIKNLI